MLITESKSDYDNLEKMSIKEILRNINKEDSKVAKAVKGALPQIEKLVEKIFERMKKGGRLFYIGAGTSGRLGVLDASECPPTYGVSSNLVVGIIAGGDKAIRHSVESAEDDFSLAWNDLEKKKIGKNDSVIGISASGKTPYVLFGLKKAKEKGTLTGCIVCNNNTEISKIVDFPIEVVVGPEFVTGSTRMKAGSAQKLVLNMISTSLMIKLGHVKGNKMIDMKLKNKKLKERGVGIIVEELKIDEKEAIKLLEDIGSVRGVLAKFK